MKKAEHLKKLLRNGKKSILNTYSITPKCYNPSYNRAIDYFDGEYIKQIAPNDVNNCVVNLSKEHRFNGESYSQKVVRTMLLVLNLIFKHAVIKQYIDINPALYISIPKNLPKKKRDMPTEDETKKVKESINCTFGLFAFLILYTGCRKGEALALQYKDIDYEAKTISITKSVCYIGNRATIKQPKTEAGMREIILLDKLAKVLKRGGKDKYVFSMDDGEPISAKKFQVMWKKYLAETGLVITPHQLRHGYATMLFEAGIDEKDAQELLGHASIAMTRDIYTHISKTRKEKTAELLNKFNG